MHYKNGRVSIMLVLLVLIILLGASSSSAQLFVAENGELSFNILDWQGTTCYSLHLQPQ